MKRLLPFKKWLAVFLFLFSTLAFSKELPNILELKYELTQNGESLGTVIEKFMIDEAGNYRIESTTKGIGLYALFGDRVLISEGKISFEGLKPKRFEVHQGSNASKNAIVDFDWDNQILITRYKGSETKENIENKTQDLISYLYQFNYENFGEPMIEFVAATGKKYKKYQFRVVDKKVELSLGNVNFETTSIQSIAEKDGKPETQIWLNNKLYRLPIRIRYQEKNGSTLEQNLVQTNIDLNGL
ncbi:Protein of unknown function DUF3108 [Candidatus Methylopumilus universalis]|uniref:DUF3108 domain-containing protein n=1 Tax=Candidatus Methylopumilus universalis TaxID=2588536 RepID=UPI003BEEFFCE